MQKTKIAIPMLLIALAVLAAFLPSLNNGFTNWDDNEYLTGNTVIRGLSWANIKSMFADFHCSNYHPLTLLSFAVEYRIAGYRPFIYHLDNLLLHLLNCFLVFWLIFIISRSVFVSTVTALLFGVHPLHVESVAWVTERKDVLYAFFYLLSLIFYSYYLGTGEPRGAGKRFYWFSLFAFVLSALSKSLAVTLPLALFVFDYLHERKFGVKLLEEKIPFLIPAFAIGLANVFAQHSTGALNFKLALVPLRNILIASRNVLFYLSKTFVPLKLSCLYPTPGDKLGPEYLMSPVIIILLAALLIFRFSRSRKIIFSSLFFAITILPALKLVPVGHVIVADRYAYIPLIGIFYLLGEGIYLFPAGKPVKHALIAVIILTLSFLTFKRTFVWKDSITLWDNVLNNYPLSISAYKNRALAEAEKGDYDGAIRDFTKSIELNPQYAEEYYNRALAYERKGDNDGALRDLNKALELNPVYYEAYCNRGVSYAVKGDLKNAVRDFRKALELDPEDESTRRNLDLALGELAGKKKNGRGR